jgi:hypothetical protein
VDLAVSKQEFARWWFETPEVCHYCGATAEQAIADRERLLAHQGHPKTTPWVKAFFAHLGGQRCDRMTIDRKDNDQPYAIGNIIKACWPCNATKSWILSETEMCGIGPRLRRRMRESWDPS